MRETAARVQNSPYTPCSLGAPLLLAARAVSRRHVCQRSVEGGRGLEPRTRTRLRGVLLGVRGAVIVHRRWSGGARAELDRSPALLLRGPAAADPASAVS
jgi:hypothetical protein